MSYFQKISVQAFIGPAYLVYIITSELVQRSNHMKLMKSITRLAIPTTDIRNKATGNAIQHWLESQSQLSVKFLLLSFTEVDGFYLQSYTIHFPGASLTKFCDF